MKLYDDQLRTAEFLAINVVTKNKGAGEATQKKVAQVTPYNINYLPGKVKIFKIKSFAVTQIFAPIQASNPNPRAQ